PTCTTEACSFQDNLAALKKRNAVVFGVSADSVDSHKKFSRKYDLAFPLLSDEPKKVLRAYGVWKKKTLFGRKFIGIVRTTFVVDKRGTIRHIFPRVRVKAHAEKVLEVLDSMKSSA
ncbi:MAG: peroxiredoxin, partial [Bacteroidota bacterium]